MKKRITIISLLITSLALMLVVGLWTRGDDEGLSSFSSDSGVGEVEGVELSPDSLVF